MTAALDDGDFCLAARFLSEENTVLKVNKAVSGGGVGGGSWMSEDDARHSLLKRELCCEYGLWSEVGSPVDAKAKAESEEDEFFAELTQRLTMSQSRKASPLNLYHPLEVLNVSGGSPQSILGGIGSWSGRSSNGSNHSPLQGPSPPATPLEAKNDTWGLIHDAAGRVARLKMNVDDPFLVCLNEPLRAVAITKNEFNHHIPPLQNVKASFYADQMKQNYMAVARQAGSAALIYEHHLQNMNRSGRFSNTRCGLASELSSQVAWPPLQHLQHQQGRVPAKPSFQGAPLQRKESAGTGVFIPRIYDTAPAALPRKNTVASSALVPAKVVQALNRNFEGISARSQQHCSPYAATISQQSYDALMARRRDFLSQQHRTVARADDVVQSNLEACLPQEWSY